MSKQHPDDILQTLLDKKPRPQKVKNLHAINELCRTGYESGSRDFSIATIGKLCEQQGVLKARGLYNAPLIDYRTLIDAWATYAGPAVPKPSVKRLVTEDYVSKIDDPALRILVQKAISERNKLKEQLNTLKAATTTVVDRRPAIHSPVASALGEHLNASERTALEKMLSKEFLVQQGWKEIDFGEVVTTKGRTVFDPGFLTGLRKLLR